MPNGTTAGPESIGDQQREEFFLAWSIDSEARHRVELETVVRIQVQARVFS